MLLDCRNVCKSFGTAELFKDVSFHIEENEKAAIIGINGCGKTTLLKIILGEMPCDSGNIVLSGGASISYLAQNQDIYGRMNIYDYVMDAKKDILEMETQLRDLELRMPLLKGDDLQREMNRYSNLTHRFELENGYACRSEVSGILKGLGFKEEDFKRCVSTLSGGQKTRVALAKSLLVKPDLLILDEPTNHLDMSSIAWLETYLLNYQSAILIVSHDRYFLDKIVTRVIEIENHTAMSFKGNYTEFAQKKAVIRRTMYNAYLNQQAEIKHQEEVITKLKSFNREKSVKRAESRQKMLDKVQRLEKPQETDTDMKLTLKPGVESGNDVLIVTGLTKSFGSNRIIFDQSFEIHKGERVALIGNNGTGKTTLLKMIQGLEPFEEGEIRFGSRVYTGYYDQEHQVLDMSKTIIDEIWDAYPDMTETAIRNVCAAFLFTGDDVFNRIETLSGGERGRISLAKLMLSKSNFLLLDEPTNHLDMYSREVLEDALNSYKGTVFFVSHDRYFINKTATRILELKNETLIPYIGNYDYYLEKCQELTKAYLGEEAVTGASAQRAPSAASIDRMARKKEQAKARKREKDLEKCEAAISDLEERINSINEQINLPENAGDHIRLMELTQELQSCEEKLESLYEQWEELSE